MINQAFFSIVAMLVLGLIPVAAGGSQIVRPDQASFEGAAPAASNAVPIEGALPEGPPSANPMRVYRGKGVVPLLIPRDEELLFNVKLSFGWLGNPEVGTVKLSSKVEPFRPNLLSLEEPDEESEQGTLTAVAEGKYTVYSIKDTITSSTMPQRWPSVIFRNVQVGTENRRREQRFGFLKGEFSGQYLRDGHCSNCDDPRHFVKPSWAWQDEHHCKGCKRGEHRTWRSPENRAIPRDTVDMLSAVYLARSMLKRGESELDFHILDKQRLWRVEITKGPYKTFDLPAGKFKAVEVKLTTSIPKGEAEDAKKSKFSGLFGIHGSLSIFMHDSGVPVLITGQVPAGPLELDVSISLASYRGTPWNFRPVGAPPLRAAEASSGK